MLKAMQGQICCAKVYDIIAWSFATLATGCHPRTNHRGEPWPAGSHRASLAGRLLTTEGHAVIYCNTAGDWKWYVETFMLAEGYQHANVCHRCLANKYAGALNYADVSLRAGWNNTVRTQSDFLRNAGDPTGLMRIPGWHVHGLTDDFLHDDLLGISVS